MFGGTIYGSQSAAEGPAPLSRASSGRRPSIERKSLQPPVHNIGFDVKARQSSPSIETRETKKTTPRSVHTGPPPHSNQPVGRRNSKPDAFLTPKPVRETTRAAEADSIDRQETDLTAESQKPQVVTPEHSDQEYLLFIKDSPYSYRDLTDATRNKLSEEMKLVNRRANLSEKEKNDLIVSALSIDTSKCAREAMKNLREKEFERSASTFGVTEQAVSQPTFRSPVSASSANSKTSTDSALSFSTAAFVESEYEDDSYAKLVEEVERCRDRMLQKASYTPSPPHAGPSMRSPRQSVLAKKQTGTSRLGDDMSEMDPIPVSSSGNSVDAPKSKKSVSNSALLQPLIEQCEHSAQTASMNQPSAAPVAFHTKDSQQINATRDSLDASALTISDVALMSPSAYDNSTAIDSILNMSGIALDNSLNGTSGSSSEKLSVASSQGIVPLHGQTTASSEFSLGYSTQDDSRSRISSSYDSVEGLRVSGGACLTPVEEFMASAELAGSKFRSKKTNGNKHANIGNNKDKEKSASNPKSHPNAVVQSVTDYLDDLLGSENSSRNNSFVVPKPQSEPNAHVHSSQLKSSHRNHVDGNEATDSEKGLYGEVNLSESCFGGRVGSESNEHGNMSEHGIMRVSSSISDLATPSLVQKQLPPVKFSAQNSRTSMNQIISDSMESKLLNSSALDETQKNPSLFSPPRGDVLESTAVDILGLYGNRRKSNVPPLFPSPTPQQGIASPLGHNDLVEASVLKSPSGKDLLSPGNLRLTSPRINGNQFGESPVGLKATRPKSSNSDVVDRILSRASTASSVSTNFLLGGNGDHNNSFGDESFFSNSNNSSFNNSSFGSPRVGGQSGRCYSASDAHSRSRGPSRAGTHDDWNSSSAAARRAAQRIIEGDFGKNRSYSAERGKNGARDEFVDGDFEDIEVLCSGDQWEGEDTFDELIGRHISTKGNGPVDPTRVSKDTLMSSLTDVTYSTTKSSRIPSLTAENLELLESYGPPAKSITVNREGHNSNKADVLQSQLPSVRLSPLPAKPTSRTNLRALEEALTAGHTKGLMLGSPAVRGLA